MFRSIADRLFLFLYRRNLRGAVRLASWCGIGGPYGRRLVLRNKFGVLCEVDPFNYIDAFIVREGFYESEVVEAVLEQLPRNGVFWDVGANSGLHCLAVASMRPDATVIAFEPSVRELARLQHGMTLNRVRITVVPFALGDRSGLASFHLCRSNTGRNALTMWGDQADYEDGLTSIHRGDEIVDQGLVPPPSVVKIDVEGAEHEVLQGMQKILGLSTCRSLVLEAGVGVETGENPIGPMLADLGFDLKRLVRKERSGHNLENYCAVKRQILAPPARKVAAE